MSHSLAVGRTGIGGRNVGRVGLGGFMNMLLPGGGRCVPNIENIGGLNVCITVAGGDDVIELTGWLCHV